ncbi:hypothetical protein BGE01nite_21930 [Brevifollis gellanilyticus]|uniref:Uncharacterized protein n=2 Tax=Brevifollis gellanilyticus TaxID=748831 RepID=A0A512M841_9BACT|nr:hypothetical protein BGE01nite_21930 [Brevifollis gellanilyticus]
MQVVDGESRSWKNAEWVALPARSLVSVPMRFLGVEGARRDSAAQLELEAAGFSSETAESHNFEIISHDRPDEKDQPIAALIQVAPLPPHVLDAADNARFVPSVAFHHLEPGEVLIWREAGSLAMAVPNAHGAPIHSQGLAARVLDSDAAAEIRRVLAGLELIGALPDLKAVCISSTTEEEEIIPATFAEGLDLPVITRRAGPPVMPEKATRLVPAPVVQLRQERQQRRMIMMGVAAFTFVLIAALGAFAMRVLLRERQLAAEEQRLNSIEPELTAIRDAKANWEDLRPALTPDQYPVESIYQLILLMPQTGIRVTRFELRTDGIVIDGEAASLGHGIEFRDKLVAAPAFKRWQWDFPAPTSLPDGRATFRAEARPPEAAADGTSTEVTSL